MSLSNTPREAVTAIQLITEIWKIYKDLGEKGMAQLARDAYELPEKERQKADAAKAVLVEYYAASEKHDKEMAALEVMQRDLGAKKADLDGMLQKMDMEKRQTESRENALKARAKELEYAAKGIEEGKQALAEGVMQHERAKADLALERQKLADYEAELKARAAEFRKLTAGL